MKSRGFGIDPQLTNPAKLPPMPGIIDYANVVAMTQRQGLRSLYHNSGAFGFAPGVPTYFVGWVGPPDGTIRDAARPFTRAVPPPYEPALAALAVEAWGRELAGPAWVLPKSHWKYELDFGSAAWMSGALAQIGIDARVLAERHDGSAIEFLPDDPGDRERLAYFLHELLAKLLGSDFAILFPGRDVIATVHHHKQVWWTATDPAVIERLGALPAAMRPAGGPAGAPR